jgi:hypothetical protein
MVVLDLAAFRMNLLPKRIGREALESSIDGGSGQLLSNTVVSFEIGFCKVDINLVWEIVASLPSALQEFEPRY